LTIATEARSLHEGRFYRVDVRPTAFSTDYIDELAAPR
jgi:hypothetical protein